MQAFGLEPGQKLLDIPCGDGFWSSVFAKAGFVVVGVDLSPGGVEMARRRYPGIEFLTGNAEETLPVPQASFDVVFSRGITHLHRRELFTDRAFRVVANLMSYVKPGGILLISYHTKRDGAGPDRHVQHPVSDLVRLVESAADPGRIEVVDDFVQIGAQHRHAPYRFPHLGRRTIRSRLRGLARRIHRLIR